MSPPTQQEVWFPGDHMLAEAIEETREKIARIDRYHVEQLAGFAARLRDEIKRLQETELAVADDPFARQSDIDARADTTAAKSGGKKAALSSSRRRKGR